MSFMSFKFINTPQSTCVQLRYEITFFLVIMFEKEKLRVPKVFVYLFQAILILTTNLQLNND